MKALLSRIRERFSKHPKGFAVYSFNNKDVVSSCKGYTKDSFDMKDTTAVQVESVLSDNIAVEQVIDIATFTAKTDKNERIEFKFYARRVNFTEIEYFFTAVTYDRTTKEMTVLSSRSIATLKSLAVRFKFILRWGEHRCSVLTPTKYQTSVSLNEQYSFELPHAPYIKYINSTQLEVKPPAVSIGADREFQVIRKVSTY